MVDFKYKPSGDALLNFMKNDKFVRGLRGPVGSGKSACCCVEMFRRATQQKPDKDGIRYTKWAIVRNTNPQLRTTTIATWLQWFPENEWGKFRWSPPFTHHIKKGDIDMEVIFLPMDTPEDVKKVLSLELTGAWVNEAREVPKTIVDAITSRVGRYPSPKNGVGATWSGVILDTNAPDQDHWWPIMAGEAPVPDHIPPEQALMLVKPDNWEFFNQPGGMLEVRGENNELTGFVDNPEAENVENLPPEYYSRMIRGKTKSWIDVYVLNRLGSLEEGKPVYAGFSEATHIAGEDFEAFPGVPLVIGIDFGLTPSAIICQRLPDGRWLFLRELVCQDMGAVRFAEELRVFLMTYFPEHDQDKMQIYGDPAGDFRAQTDERTPFDMLRAAGIRAIPAPSNDPVLRVEAVNSVLSRMVNGNPGVLVDRQACPVLTNGFLGGYHYRRLQISGERYDDRPNKNKFSHVHDALQYAIIGAGEGRAITTGGKPMNAFVAKRKKSVMARMKARSSRFG